MTVILGTSPLFTLRHVFLLFQLAFGILSRALREEKCGYIFSSVSNPFVGLRYLFLFTILGLHGSTMSITQKEKKGNIFRVLLANVNA